MRTTKTRLTKTMVDCLGSPPVATVTVQDDLSAMMRGRLMARDPSSRKARSPHQRCGLPVACFPRERRYAELGYLLPFLSQAAVETRCIGPSSWHALYIYPTTVRTFGYAPDGHRARPQSISQRRLRDASTPIPPEGVCVQGLV